MNEVTLLYTTRTAELRKVMRLLEDVEHFPILNVYAMRGLGKTTFLNATRNTLGWKKSVAFVRATDYLSSDTEAAFPLDQLLRQIVEQLVFEHGTSSEHDEITDDVPSLTQKLIELSAAYIKQETPPIILIDDYDKLPDGTQRTLEDTVISRLIESPRHAKFLLTTEQPLTFANRFLMAKREILPLTPLDVDDIATAAPGIAKLAPEILRWSGGVPNLVGLLVTRLDLNGITTVEEYYERAQEVLSPKYREHVKNIAFPDIKAASDEALDILALLRRFDVAIMSTILPELKREYFSEYKQKHYLDLINDLGSRVYWRDQGGYVLDSMLQAMLASYTRVFERELFDKVNTLAAEAYEKWLTEQYRQYFLLEMLFHKIMLGQSNGTNEDELRISISESLGSHIRGRLKNGPDDVDGLDSLKHAIERDDDIRPYVTDEILSMINAMLESKRVRVSPS